MSANEWLKIIQDKRFCKEDVVPDGYKTRPELEKIWDVKQAEALDRIKRLIKADLIESKIFKIKTTRGIYPTPHYKIIK